MAAKNWLIRTKNKQILGPATKDKVIELVEKGSLTGDDEITSGNGYWFWVKEKDLLERYLYGDVPQTFNPISEAQDVLTAKSSPEGITASVVESPQKAKAKAEAPNVTQLPQEDDLAYPEDEDLDYPDMDSIEDSHEVTSEVENQFEDHSLTGEIELGSQLKSTPAPAPKKDPPTTSPAVEGNSDEDEENFMYPSASDLEYPENEETESEEEFSDDGDTDQTDPNVTIPQDFDNVDDSESYQENYPENYQEEASQVEASQVEEEGGIAYEEEVKSKSKKGKRKKRVLEARKGSDRYLIIMALLIGVAIAVVFYYYKMVLNKPFPIVGMSEAHAQTITSLSKKKIF